ncbi:MAG: DUF2934 domain-containing protein [Verrucomicrobia bacterium]|nr:DUF2934 domain-containing protein [Verrucomicrobiota bacterium]
MPPSAGPNPDEIAARAYLIWEKEGRPVGRDFEHWLLAEAQLKTIAPETAPAPAKDETIVLRNPRSAHPSQSRRRSANKSRSKVCAE